MTTARPLRRSRRCRVFPQDVDLDPLGLLLAQGILFLFAFIDRLDNIADFHRFFGNELFFALEEIFLFFDLEAEPFYLFHDGDDLFLAFLGALLAVLDLLQQGRLLPAGLNLHHLRLPVLDMGHLVCNLGLEGSALLFQGADLFLKLTDKYLLVGKCRYPQVKGILFGPDLVFDLVYFQVDALEGDKLVYMLVQDSSPVKLGCSLKLIQYGSGQRGDALSVSG